MPKRYPLAAFAAVIAMAAARAWTSDDAFITFRVVEQLLAGQGPVFNIGERVQVFTHPLWFAALAAWSALGGSLFPGTMWLSLALFGAGLACLFAAFRDKPLALLAAAAAMFFSRALMDFATGGLETALSFALFAAAVAALRSGRSRAALALLALLPLNRFDLLPWALPFAWIAAAPNARARSLAVLALCAPAAAWALFATIYYGAPLPNTALAKLGGDALPRLDQGLAYVVASLVSDPGALALFILGIVAAVRLWRGAAPALPAQERHVVAAGAASAAIALAYAIWCGGDFMLGRFLLPVLWALIAVIIAGFPPAASGERHDRRTASLAFALLAALHLLTGQSTTNLWLRLAVDSPLREVNYAFAIDERRFYISSLGAYSPGRFTLIAPRAAPPATGEPSFALALGRHAYLAAREQLVLDVFAIADPLLARIAPLPHGRPGHEFRPMPPGLARWRDPEHRFADRRLDGLANDLRLAHLSPRLWSMDRAAAILRLASARPVRSEGFAIAEDGAQWLIDIRPEVLHRGATRSAQCQVWLRRFDASERRPWGEATSALDRDCRATTVPREENARTTLEMGCAQTLSLRCPKARLEGGGILMSVEGDEIIALVRPSLWWVGSVARWIVQGWYERPRPAIAVAALLALAAFLFAMPARRR